MEEDQLKVLETRINKAIAFIERVKTREKILLKEREELKEKITSLESTVEQKDKKIEELKESQRYLKDKIESILTKLENLEGLDRGAEHQLGYEPESVEEKETAGEDELKGSSEDLIIEESIVDLKKEDTEGELLQDASDSRKETDEVQEEESNDTLLTFEKDKKTTPRKNEEEAETLFRINDAVRIRNEANVDGIKTGWFEHNPFIEL